MRTLARIGDRLLSNLIPQIPAAACVPPDLHDICEWIDSDCGSNGMPTQVACFYNCAGDQICNEVGCC